MITSKDYDERIRTYSLQELIDILYVPKDVSGQRRIDIIIKALEPKAGEKILDVGCGVGAFTFHCAKSGAETSGIDYSPESIKVANELCARFGVSQNATFVIGNATRLPFVDGYFDKIIAVDFIEHITTDEKEILLKEVHRVLKPEGRVVIFTPNGIREKIGYFYWKMRNILFKDTIPTTKLHYGLTHKSEFEKICRRYNFSFKFRYEDVTRPYLAKIPLLRNVFALNLLWVMRKVSRL